MDVKFIPLQVLYGKMPKTTGCEKCHGVNGERVHWCCREIPPELNQYEFDYIWTQIFHTMKREKIKKVINNAIKFALIASANTEIGCPFYDNGCTIYEWRPYTCRAFGILEQDFHDAERAAIKETRPNTIYCGDECHLVEGKKISLFQALEYLAYGMKIMKNQGYDPGIHEFNSEQMHIFIIHEVMVKNPEQALFPLIRRVLAKSIDLESAISMIWRELVKDKYVNLGNKPNDRRTI